jgi:hypothetical protein
MLGLLVSLLAAYFPTVEAHTLGKVRQILFPFVRLTTMGITMEVTLVEMILE